MKTIEERRAAVRERLRSAPVSSSPLVITDQALRLLVEQQASTIKDQAKTIEEQRGLISDVTQALTDDEGESNG